MINLRKNDSVADAIKNILQQEEIDQKQRTKDMLSGRFNTQQKDDVGPGSDSKSTKVKYHPGPETQKEETVEEGWKDTLKKVGKAAGKALTGGSDEDQLKDLQRKMGLPQTGKKPAKTLKSMKEEFEEPIIDSLINEVLSKDASAGSWIHDFVHSDNPKFDGKSKAKRKEMALAAYYAKQRNEEVVDEALKGDQHKIDKNKNNKIDAQDFKILRGQKKANEEVEQIDELSKGTLGSYAKKASRDATIQRKIGADFETMADRSRKPSMKDASTTLSNKYKDKARSRLAGVGKAVDRLTKEESEEISENSPFDWKKPREPEVKGGAGVKAGRAYGGAAQKSKPEQEPEEKKK